MMDPHQLAEARVQLALRMYCRVEVFLQTINERVALVDLSPDQVVFCYEIEINGAQHSRLANITQAAKVFVGLVGHRAVLEQVR